MRLGGRTITVSPAGTPVPATKNRPSASFWSTLIRHRAMHAADSAFSCAKRSGATTGLGCVCGESQQVSSQVYARGHTQRTSGTLSVGACSCSAHSAIRRGTHHWRAGQNPAQWCTSALFAVPAVLNRPRCWDGLFCSLRPRSRYALSAMQKSLASSPVKYVRCS